MFRLIDATNARIFPADDQQKPTHFCVTTMTVSGKLDATAVPIDDILERLTAHGGRYLDIALPDSALAGRRFYNQITVKLGRTSVKVFRNGSVHVTGARSVVHFGDVVDRMLTTIGLLMDTTETMALVEAQVRLINANFNAGRKLPLRVLRDAIALTGVTASYDSSEYPGINAKMPCEHGVVSTLIFKTGSIIIAGAKCPLDAARVYAHMCDAIQSLDRHAENTPPNVVMRHIGSRLPVTHALLETYDIIDGYSSRLSHLCAWQT